MTSRQKDYGLTGHNREPRRKTKRELVIEELRKDPNTDVHALWPCA